MIFRKMDPSIFLTIIIDILYQSFYKSVSIIFFSSLLFNLRLIEFQLLIFFVYDEYISELEVVVSHFDQYWSDFFATV